MITLPYSIVFPKLEIQVKPLDCHYYLGVDTYDKNALAYCLVRKINDSKEILLCKTMKDEDEFNKVVSILSEQFNATVHR